MTLGWPWHILWQGQIWSVCFCMGKKAKQWIFQKLFESYDIKVGRCSQQNEYMKLYEYQRSKSFIDLRPRSLRFNIFLFSLETGRPIEAKFHVEPTMEWGNESEYKIAICHMIKMATMSIYYYYYYYYYKNLLKSSSLEPKGGWPWKLVCSFGYSSTTKFVQMMTSGRPWLILQQCQGGSLLFLFRKDFHESIEASCTTAYRHQLGCSLSAATYVVLLTTNSHSYRARWRSLKSCKTIT